MKKNILLIATIAFASAVLVSSCNKPLGKCDEFYEADCVTTEAYIPVCGCNDKTYANKSFAECAGVEYVNGSCN